MRAMAIQRFGGPGEMRETKLDDPLVGPDSVLIRIAAAGVNPVDTKLRDGSLAGAIPHFFPLVPGWDAAGTVEQAGPAAVEFAVGDPVVAYCRKDLVQGGTYAELVSVRVPQVAASRGLAVATAGALPLAGLTAYQCLHDGLGIQAGETVVIRGASGGVGHLAVQIARAAGARVIGIAGGDAEGFVRELGAEGFVDYRTTDVLDALRDLCPAGADALLDAAGGGELTRLAAAVRPGGRIASILVPQAPEGLAERDIAFRHVFVRPDGAQLAQLVELVLCGEVRVEIAETYALGEAARAHERMEQGGVHGKLVLRV